MERSAAFLLCIDGPRPQPCPDHAPDLPPPPTPCPSSQAWEAAPRPRGGDQHFVQRSAAGHHLHPRPGLLRQRSPFRLAARGHHLRLPGDPRVSKQVCVRREGVSVPTLTLPHADPRLLPLSRSNTRSCSPVGSARASLSAMARAWARAARWPASSWRTTCGAERRPCGELSLPGHGVGRRVGRGFLKPTGPHPQVQRLQ